MLRLKISPFSWDGSHLGSFTSDIVHWIVDYGELHYCCLTVDGVSVVSLIKQSKDRFPAIVDELKPIFGLRKLGTHTINLAGKLHLLTYCRLVNGQPLDEPKLSNVESTAKYKDQVQDIFAFREILGLNSSFESSIRLRDDGQEIYPVSFREASSIVEKEKTALPGTIISKWFGQTTVSTVTKRITGWSAQIDKVELVAELRKKIEGVINRIDKDFIFYSVYIVSRIQGRLETSSSINVGWKIE